MARLLGEISESRKNTVGTEEKDGGYVDYSTGSRSYLVIGNDIEEDPESILSDRTLDIPRLWDRVDGMVVTSVEITETGITVINGVKLPLYQIDITMDSRNEGVRSKDSPKPLGEEPQDEEGGDTYNIPQPSLRWRYETFSKLVTEDFSNPPKPLMNAVGEPILYEHPFRLKCAVVKCYTLEDVEQFCLENAEVLNKSVFCDYQPGRVKLNIELDYEERELGDADKSTIVWRVVTLSFVFDTEKGVPGEDNEDQNISANKMFTTALQHTGTKYKKTDENGNIIFEIKKTTNKNGQIIEVEEPVYETMMVGDAVGQCYLTPDGRLSNEQTVINFTLFHQLDFKELKDVFHLDFEKFISKGLNKGKGAAKKKFINRQQRKLNKKAVNEE